ncbi:AMP-binding protein [Rubrivivax albus]|uniref:Long-chain fatty acid--CoA ligase n=1 Tax=Rubrivivax albus TaxID=2499835 RepID=A0A3S2U6P7_9BURK|nr:AMP-binding protein [Rubrivivax albus]RVT49384.1 long-chain fatty acid--CoA ligase [Rubrivivax albus]
MSLDQATLIFEGRTHAPEAFSALWRRNAAALQAQSVGDGDVVALLMRNSVEAIAAMVAVRHLGAIWCPINWHLKTDEVAYVLAASGARVLLVDAPLLAALPGLDTAGARPFTVRGEVPGVSAWAPLRDDAAPLTAPPAPPRGAMFFTSGTTGRPKGIVRQPMTADQAVRQAEMRRLAYGTAPDMRALLCAPWYHSAPCNYALGIVQEGGTLVVEDRFDAERTLALIEQQRLTHAYLVPTMYVRLLALPAEVRTRYDLSSMRFVSSTGSPCPPEVKRRMIEWWGPVIHECYGASELGYMTLLTSEQALRKPGSAGMPLPDVTLKILDDEGRELPRGTPGLIWIDQPATPDFSYAGNAQARAAMARGDLKTMGDVGYLDDDGFLFIVDRAADMVISGGVNIYPVEVELLLQTLPGVADCAVFGIPDDEFGEALAAAVQPAPDADLSPDAIRAWLHDRIAGYKVPRVVTLHDALPREDTGKIFKRRLREPYWTGRSRRV